MTAYAGLPASLFVLLAGPYSLSKVVAGHSGQIIQNKRENSLLVRVIPRFMLLCYVGVRREKSLSVSATRSFLGTSISLFVESYVPHTYGGYPKRRILIVCASPSFIKTLVITGCVFLFLRAGF